MFHCFSLFYYHKICETMHFLRYFSICRESAKLKKKTNKTISDYDSIGILENFQYCFAIRYNQHTFEWAYSLGYTASLDILCESKKSHVKNAAEIKYPTFWQHIWKLFCVFLIRSSLFLCCVSFSTTFGSISCSIYRKIVFENAHT